MVVVVVVVGDGIGGRLNGRGIKGFFFMYDGFFFFFVFCLFFFFFF